MYWSLIVGNLLTPFQVQKKLRSKVHTWIFINKLMRYSKRIFMNTMYRLFKLQDEISNRYLIFK